MKYTVTHVFEVEGDISLEEAEAAVNTYNNTFDRKSSSLDVKVFRYATKPGTWDDEHPDEQWDTTQHNTFASVALVRKNVATTVATQ